MSWVSQAGCASDAGWGKRVPPTLQPVSQGRGWVWCGCWSGEGVKGGDTLTIIIMMADAQQLPHLHKPLRHDVDGPLPAGTAAAARAAATTVGSCGRTHMWTHQASCRKRATVVTSCPADETPAGPSSNNCWQPVQCSAVQAANAAVQRLQMPSVVVSKGPGCSAACDALQQVCGPAAGCRAHC